MSRPSPSASLSWIAGLPLPQAGPEPSFRIELAVVSDVNVSDASRPRVGQPLVGQPFISLGDNDHFSRVLLARLAGPGGTVVQGLALKLQRDYYRARSTGSATSFDNRDVEAMWQREQQYLLRLGGNGSARLVAIGPGRGVMPPMAFDNRSRRLFPVVSPESWRPLQVCSEDATLREAGLETWSGTTSRFLHCPADDSAFYTWSKQDGKQAKPGIRVRRRHDLYRDLQTAWAKLSGAEQESLRVRLPDLAAVLADLRDEDVETRITPLSYYGAWALATELQDVHFDEFCDLAGGATLAQAVGERGGPGRAPTLEVLTTRLGGEQQWLAAPWTAGDRVETLCGDTVRLNRLAIEATCLKLQAFVQVCQAVAAHHRELIVPHLGLSSDNIMLRLAGHGRAMAPIRWCFEAALVDVGSSHRHLLQGLGQSDALGAMCQPGTDAVGAYLSPQLDAAHINFELGMQVTATPLRLSDRVIGLQLDLRSSRERLDRLQIGDIVRLDPDAALPSLGEQALLARVVAVRRDGAVAEVQLDEALATTLPGEPFSFAATASFHQRLQPPSDLFALGMLLARALLVHDERDVFAVREVWDRMLDKLEMMLGGAKAAEPERIAATLRHLIDTEREHLGSASVLWPAALRRCLQEPVPATEWRELLLLIGRLLTMHAGFSFAAHHGDVVDGEPDAPLRRVIQHAEELLAALQLELTESASRAAELADIAGELAREINASMVGGTGGAP